MSKNKGFTLIELMIVVAIIGILSMIAVPAYRDYTRRTYIAEGLALASSLITAVVEQYSSTGRWPDSNHAAGVPATPQYKGQSVLGITIGHGPSGMVGHGGPEEVARDRKISNIRIFYNEKVTGVANEPFKTTGDPNDPKISPDAHKNSLTLAPVTNEDGHVTGSIQWVCMHPQVNNGAGSGYWELKWLPSTCRMQAVANGPASH